MTAIPIHSFKRVQDLRAFLDEMALRGYADDLEYPSYLAWSSSRRAWFIRSGVKVYYWINGKVERD